MPTKQLVEKREELTGVRDKLKKAFSEGRGGEKGAELDLAKITTYTGTEMEKLDEIRKDQLKSNDLQSEVTKLVAMDKEAADKLDGIPSDDEIDPEGAESLKRWREQRQKLPDIGDLVAKNDATKKFVNDHATYKFEIDHEGADESILQGEGVKAVFQRSGVANSGWIPESVRIGMVVPQADPPPSVIDTIPRGRTSQAVIKYMEETTKTNAAAERSEGAAYAESAFELEEKTQTVQTIGHLIPVTDEQLQDVPQARDYLNLRMGEGIRRRVDRQILLGDGADPNTQGISGRTGLQTSALLVGENPADETLKAISNVRWTGDANPNVIYMHPNDWYSIRIMKTTTKEYLWGPPFATGQDTMWGLQVVLTNQLPFETVLVGDTRYVQLWIRRGVEILTGYRNNEFGQGVMTIRAGMRVAIAVYRSAAWHSLTNYAAN